jgi:hypothetical protein
MSLCAIIVIAPPAKANIMQVLMLITNFITTNLNGFNASIQQESAGSQTQANAMQQSTEVLSGVIANGTKVLGQLEYSLNWKGSGKFNSIAAAGCLLLKGKNNDVNDSYEERFDNTIKNEMPAINDYARFDNSISIEDDKKNRTAISQIIEDSEFPLSGLFPNQNITPSQRTVWGEYVKYLTVPSPVNITGLSGARSGNKGRQAFRYQQLVAPVQKVLLTYGDKYTAESNNEISRMDVFKTYKAIATSPKRISAMVNKTGVGLDRESALAQSMLLDVEGEIMEVNENITSLLSVMAILATDEIADDL